MINDQCIIRAEHYWDAALRPFYDAVPFYDASTLKYVKTLVDLRP